MRLLRACASDVQSSPHGFKSTVASAHRTTSRLWFFGYGNVLATWMSPSASGICINSGGWIAEVMLNKKCAADRVTFAGTACGARTCGKTSSSSGFRSFSLFDVFHLYQVHQVFSAANNWQWLQTFDIRKHCKSCLINLHFSEVRSKSWIACFQVIKTNRARQRSAFDEFRE